MIIHTLCEKFLKQIKKNAKKIGLDKLDFGNMYYVTKIKSKSSEDVLSDFKIRGVPCLMGDRDYVWMYFSNIGEWFKTSPVVSVEINGKNATIETENSTYYCERV